MGKGSRGTGLGARGSGIGSRGLSKGLLRIRQWMRTLRCWRRIWRGSRGVGYAEQGFEEQRMNARVFSFVVAIGFAQWVCAAEPAATQFRFEAVSEKSLGLWEGDKPVLVYNHGAITRENHGPITREGQGGRGRACYFHPIYGLD